MNDELKIVKPWGGGDLMVIAAFRYCLGRQTYIVSACVDWLMDIWRDVTENARGVIRRDLLEEFERDDKARLSGSDFRPLGDNCDRAEWVKLRDFIESKAQDNA